MPIITGIGSRQTPYETLFHMQLIGQWCLKNSVTLRSGHCEGADWEFEKGAQGCCVAYLPWAGFNSHLHSEAILKHIEYHDTSLLKISELVFDNHANPYALNNVSYKFMARNCHQVLGDNLDDPSYAVVCYTPDGKHSGGTGFAMNLARTFDIPIINMYDEKYDTSGKVIYTLIDILSSKGITL